MKKPVRNAVKKECQHIIIKPAELDALPAQNEVKKTHAVCKDCGVRVPGYVFEITTVDDGYRTSVWKDMGRE